MNRGIFLLIFSLFLFSLFSQDAYSQYFRHTRNEYLREQIQDQTYRVIPKSEWGVFVIDTFLFKDWAHYGYYHGNGYWVNMFAELQPNKDMRINIKIMPYNGASSYGYSQENYIHSVVGMSWDPSFFNPDWKLSLRYFDLDRETFGVGLLGEDKEIAGFRSSLRHNDFHYKVIIDGTGYYQKAADTYYQHIDYKNELIGVSYLFLVGSVSPRDKYGNLSDPQNYKETSFGPQLYTIFSKIPWNNWLTSKIELGAHQNKSYGGLVALSSFHEKTDYWSVKTNLQYRVMESGFLEPFAGSSANAYGGLYTEYVTPEILDKPYTEVKNIIRYSDRVEAYSARVEAKYRITPDWSLESDNEIYVWQFPDYNKYGYFYRLGLGFCPYAERRSDCLQFYVSNKILNAYAETAYSTTDPNFVKQAHFGLNSFIYF